ncbi:DUF4180 domain-containing protein [Papillibacter cinnamivorans]|uniref:DNA-binding transcriptional regulator, PadR family n=1 Tax=Papillibacter cinnamivorans DSM 12816 TaxID=1122930 RepID=A0A1W2CU68_9FIRM|nr:DUF4180 domain-containing protein [Papillibacter cinnamivorans]SMC88790.1 DNA-binding transcriptional regulator, PadR family [Papillibacter cinnamivorans DSM 12816]
MTVQHAILGFLSLQPMTGYELKKLIRDSSFMPWSGNNNQIYTALLELLEDGFVVSEVQAQENLPSKKVYTITQKGMDRLAGWTKASPEPPEFKKPFLIQLLWADLLNKTELSGLLEKYESEVRVRLLMHRERTRRGSFFIPRTEREALLWRITDENIALSYESELEWVRSVRSQLLEQDDIEVKSKMDFRMIQKENASYVEVFDSQSPVGTEQEALDLVSICGEKDTNLLMLHSEALPEEFFRLKTGVAGAVLQKLVNYSVKTAILLPELKELGARFRDLLSETNRGSQYRFFKDRVEAEHWLISGM